MTEIIMLTSVIAVLLACAGFVMQDAIDARRDLDEDVLSFGRLIGANVNAALTFGDEKTATEVLSVLRTKQSFIAGAVYTDHDVLFASYSHGGTLPPILHGSNGIVRRNGRVELFQPITRDGERIGTLYIASDLRDFHARMKEDGLVTAVILFVCVIVAFTLSRRLQGRISQPIVDLARLTGEVSQHKDYTVRA
ncbi:MAG TPA: CHASE sensor domain-containing protein, partial [Gemmatimonadaceae bacterium]